MEANAELWIYCADKTLINNIPANQVFVHIIKIGGVQHVECISLWGDTRYVAGYQNNGAILGWKKYTSQA